MRIELEADDRRWLVIPVSFPTADGLTQSEWEDDVVRGMRDAWNGALTPVAEEALREALRHAASEVDDDSITLQFWPTASLVNAIVHIAVREFAPGEGPVTVPLDDADYVVEPVSVLIGSDHLGTGVESRFLITVDSEPPLTLGAVNFLFENDRGQVLVRADATLPNLIGLMLEPLRGIVRSLRVHDDEIGPWRRSTVDPRAVPSRGESWGDVPSDALKG